jgi:hypothetical protein
MTKIQTIPNKPIYQSKSVIMAFLFLVVETLQHLGWIPAGLDSTIIEGAIDQTTGVITGDYTTADFMKYLFGLAAIYFRTTAKTAVENVATSVKKAPGRIVTWFKGLFKKKV